MRIVLASASLARRELLQRAGYTFEVIPAGIQEPEHCSDSGPAAYVAHVARLKAEAVASRVAEGVVIAADSIVWHQGQVIGKPVDREDARRILERLAGTEHELWTGTCLWLRPEDWQLAWQEVSRVYMRPWTKAGLEAYLASGTWEGKSGAYAIQEKDDPYVELRSGSLTNVIGLPMERLSAALHMLTLARRQLTKEPQALTARLSQLEKEARTDPLTGLPNRRAALELLRQLLQPTPTRNEPLVVALLDIDDFRKINERYLLTGGDRVLAQLGQRLRQIVRSTDVIARYGGDEFLLLAPGVDSQSAQAFIRRLQESLGSMSMPLGPSSITVTASAGAVVLGPACKSSDTLDTASVLEKAAQALAWAKAQGPQGCALCDA